MSTYEAMNRQAERARDKILALLKAGYCGKVTLHFDVSGLQPLIKKEETENLNLR